MEPAGPKLQILTTGVALHRSATMYGYDAAFQQLATASGDAALRIVEAVKCIIDPASVLDIGCARGTWLRAWQKCGVTDVVGMDGPYVDKRDLEIETSRFITADLNECFAL